MSKKKNKIWKNKKKQKSIRRTFVLFFHVPLTLLYTITSSWCGRFDTPCMYYNSHNSHININTSTSLNLISKSQTYFAC
jgi:hypothetical protein